MKRKVIHLVAGARPNFMKIAPLYHVLRKRGWCEPVLVHTGQHYDYAMSQTFFEDLDIPEPDIYLDAGSGSHAQQTAKIMLRYEEACRKSAPDLVVVPGDVNSTLACSVTAKKMLYPVAHLEAGLRSNDMTMPEEINRRVTDSICDILWTPSGDADENLLREGIAEDRIQLVGNIMIDSLLTLERNGSISAEAVPQELASSPFGLVTLHRPSNVDDPAKLEKLVHVLLEAAAEAPLVFPVHPRTAKQLERQGLRRLLEMNTNVFLVPPLGYNAFVGMLKQACFVITDSGGLQEETTYLGIPCLTLRGNTERPVTVSLGTNRLVSADSLADHLAQALAGSIRGEVPPLWDGKTALRIAARLETYFGVTDA